MCDNCGTIHPTVFAEKGVWLPGAVAEPVKEVLERDGWIRPVDGAYRDLCPGCSDLSALRDRGDSEDRVAEGVPGLPR